MTIVDEKDFATRAPGEPISKPFSSLIVESAKEPELKHGPTIEPHLIRLDRLGD